MIPMVRLTSKVSENKTSAELTVHELIDTLAKRGMPHTSLIAFQKQLARGSKVDGASLYMELANVIFTPFTITKEEHIKRNTRRT